MFHFVREQNIRSMKNTLKLAGHQESKFDIKTDTDIFEVIRPSLRC